MPENFLKTCTNKGGQDSLLLEVLVSPRSRLTQINSIHDGRIKIQVAAPPSDGSANQALLTFLSNLFGVRKSAVSIAKGLSSRRKSLLIEGLAYQTVLEMINKQLKAGG